MNKIRILLITTVLLLGMSVSSSFAEITSDSWNFDTRYNYNRTSSSHHNTTTKKSASVNFTLDGDVNKTTSVDGIFTLNESKVDNANTIIFDDDDVIRQLYVSHTTNDGTDIKVGKQVSNYDNKKAIQDLRIYGGFCDPSSKKICNGILSLYVKKNINKNTEIEFLAGDVNSAWHSRGSQYTTHIKHKKRINEYHLTLNKLDFETLYKYSNGQYDYTNTGDRDSSNISLALEIEGTGKDKYYISHSRIIGDSNTTVTTVDTLDLSNEMPLYITTSESKDVSTTFGKIMFFDKLFVRANIHRSKYSDKYSGQTVHRLLTGTAKITSNIEFTLTGVGLYLEYPLESGKISSHHGYLTSDNKALIGAQLSNRVEITYDLPKDLSSTLSYTVSKSGQHHTNGLSFEIRQAF